MRVALSSLALLAFLGTTASADRIVTLPLTTEHTFSTGAKITIFNLEIQTGGGRQLKPGFWISTPANPVCYAYCLNPAIPDCEAPCEGKTIKANFVYVQRDATSGFWGTGLAPCASGVGVCALEIPGNPAIDTNA